MRISLLIALAFGALLASPVAQAADSLFAPRVLVNDRAVTNYEFDQRVQFLRALSTTGDLEQMALKDLVEDRLRVQAAASLGIELTEEDVTAGLTEFASRANLSVDEFTAALAEYGVEPETFRDFVTAGLLWREVIRDRFAPRAFVSEGEIDRALSVTKQRGGVRLLLSELILPAPQGEEQDAIAQAEELAASIRTTDDFAAAAAQFSAAPSAENGGQIDWIDLGNLPPALREIVLGLQPGEVTAPIIIPNAVALFQLRGVQETGRPETQAINVDYMQLLLPETEAGGAEALRLRNSADRCEDIYGLVKGAPESQLTRVTQASGEVPRDIALELAKLDAGETSFALRRGGARVFLMLCARDIVPVVPEGAEPRTRDQIRAQLINQRLAAAADGYMRELRAAAVIREP